MTTSYLRYAAVAVAALALPAQARAQVKPTDDPAPLLGCYYFNGADDETAKTFEERFRLSSEPGSPAGSPRGTWRIVTRAPGELPRPGTGAWAVAANSMINVLWDYESVRVLLQFPQLEDLDSAPVEGMLAGPGPKPGVAQVAKGFVVRGKC